jgi:hypothetical protein
MKGWPKGKEHSPQTRLKISKAMTGKNHPMWGKKNPGQSKHMIENNPMKRSEVAKRCGETVISNASKAGKNNPMFGKKNPDFSEYNRTRLNPMKGKKRPDVSERMKEVMKNGGAARVASFNKNPSKEQVKLFEMVKHLYPSAILNYPYKRYCLDVAIPEMRVDIEFDGYYWHKGREEVDMKRQIELENDGWKVIRYIKLPDGSSLRHSILSFS